MKKTGMLLWGAAALLAAFYLVGTGFKRCESAYDYAVSADGTVCLDFISAFGGINGSIGASTVYQIALGAEARMAALHGEGGGCEAALKTDPLGVWRRV